MAPVIIFSQTDPNDHAPFITLSQQVPEYISRYAEFTSKGVKDIYVLSVNDIFVMKAWKKDLVSKAEGDDTKIIFGTSRARVVISEDCS